MLFLVNVIIYLNFFLFGIILWIILFSKTLNFQYVVKLRAFLASIEEPSTICFVLSILILTYIYYVIYFYIYIEVSNYMC
jgi:hypothetical protein